MNLQIIPTNLTGVVSPPASKSVLHRALVLALLSKGTTTLTNVSMSDDVWASAQMIESFGAVVHVEEASRTIEIESTGTLLAPTKPIHCKESGTTYRFAVALAMCLQEDVVISGDPGLMARPIDGYDSLLPTHHIALQQQDHTLIVKGSLHSEHNWVVDGSKSSQFISGLLLAALAYKTPITIEVLGTLSSAAYVDITTHVMSAFGAMVSPSHPLFYVERGLLQAREYPVEVDHSQAAVWHMARSFFPMVDVQPSTSFSTQPDWFMQEFLANNPTKKCFEVNVDATPDIAPLLMLYATQCDGTSIIRGTSRLRYKESDRVGSSLTTLQSFGASSIIRDDEVVIKGPVTLQGCMVDSYQDHRIVMMATIAATLAKGPTTILNAQAISKSYPSFFEDFKALGGHYEIST
jgi:3-phosphoshikimate 1-carboxyvinyltransferase